MALITTLTGKCELNYTLASGGTTGSFRPVMTFSDALSSGVIVDAGDKAWWRLPQSITGSATDSHDLDALTDAYGAALAFVVVKAVIIHNLSTTVGNTITVGGNANGIPIFGTAAHTHTIGPNGVGVWHEPSLAGLATLVASTGDILDVANDTANAVTYDIMIIGTSA